MWIFQYIWYLIWLCVCLWESRAVIWAAAAVALSYFALSALRSGLCLNVGINVNYMPEDARTKRNGQIRQRSDVNCIACRVLNERMRAKFMKSGFSLHSRRHEQVDLGVCYRFRCANILGSNTNMTAGVWQNCIVHKNVRTQREPDRYATTPKAFTWKTCHEECRNACPAAAVVDSTCWSHY